MQLEQKTDIKKEMNKKIFTSAMAAAAFAVSFTSCDNSNKQPEAAAPAQSNPTELKIGYVEVDSIMSQYQYCKDYTLVLEKKSQNIQATLQQKGAALQNAAANFQQKLQQNAYTEQQARQIQAGLQPDAPCGGAGTCGKCLVDVLLEDGTFETVKACQTFVDKDMTIRVKEETTFHVLESGTKRSFILNPAMSLEEIKAKKALGAAFDIGTTSVVCYLLNLENSQYVKEIELTPKDYRRNNLGKDCASRDLGNLTEKTESDGIVSVLLPGASFVIGMWKYQFPLRDTIFPVPKLHVPSK